MEIQANHTTKLLNAKCEYVLAVDNLAKKLEYGESIECCVNNFFLASRLIGRLECYCFEDLVLVETEILSVFSVTMPSTLSSATTYSLAVNGIYVATYISNGSLGLDGVFEELLIQAGLTYSVGAGRESTEFTITANCDTTDIFFKKDTIAGPQYTVFSPSILGACSVGCCDNCIKQSDLNEMYSVLDQLLS